MPSGENVSPTSAFNKSGSPRQDASSGLLLPSAEEKQKALSETKAQRASGSPVLSESPTGLQAHHGGHKFNEVFQVKQGRYADIHASKISEMIKSNSLENAPTQSLLSVVNGILDESAKTGEFSQNVACLLRKAVQEIERRISTQAEHLRTQNNLFKNREDKYQSRIKVLEVLASGTADETKGNVDQLQQVKVQLRVERTVKRTLSLCYNFINACFDNDHWTMKRKTEKLQTEEIRKLEEEVARLMKERDQSSFEITTLKQELDIAKRTYELQRMEMESKAKGSKSGLEDRVKELEKLLLEMEKTSTGSKTGLEGKVKDLENQLVDSKNKANELEYLLTSTKMKLKEIEASSESKSKNWSTKENMYHTFIDFQFGALRELTVASDSIKQEVLKTQRSYSEDFDILGLKFKASIDAAANYYSVLAENRKLFNELQDLKGNIRVYCRIRPFLPGQNGKKTLVESIGEYGELVVANPSKPGKEGQRSFRFNKIFGPAATQANVYTDIEPFVRSVVDGYNVCIFAYGQTGSGKTYTMTGPSRASDEEWGVNYRALNDLFTISQNRKSSFSYEVGVQMVEIYNEQVRDLLAGAGAKKIGITSISQPNGLAVPEATMQPVTSTSDVLDIMDIGLKNRAVSSTAMNERSSRSHSIVTIHVRGKDLKTGALLYGNLHLVDLAGSERIDRSEVTGDRLKEAQHINKSLSSLGDVIFSLSQKSSHVPYRNSKLTQVLQSSLGGQAKTLMFVQLNPDVTSYSESMSTLKFAERASGVELGAAKSSKEGRDVRELMEQVASLKDTISRKDDEIERLQLLKDLKNLHPGVEQGSRLGLSSPRSTKQSGVKGLLLSDKAALDPDNYSDYSDKRSEGGSQQSMDDDSRLSDISDGVSGVTEPDGTSDTASPRRSSKLSPKPVTKSPRFLQKPTLTSSASMSRDAPRSPGVKRSTSSLSLKQTTKRFT